jgi:hypothetical protein
MFAARAFRNGTSSMLASSASFAVMGPTPTVETDRTTYAYRDPIGVSWTNFSDYTYDQIVVSRSPPAGFYDDYFYYDFSSGVQAGSASLHVPLPPGAYLLQAFDDRSSIVATSPTFVVTGPGPTIIVPEIIVPGASVPVTFEGIITQSADAYVSLVGVGPSPPTGGYVYVNTDSGTVTFAPLYVGRYRAELHDWFGPPTIDHLLATQELVVTSDTSCEAGTLPVPDETACSSGHACFEGACLPISGTCGDGVRNAAASPREGCDDGYQDAGDACDATCEPTALTIASRTGLEDRPAAQLPAMAEDGTGRLLFVWLSERVVGGEGPLGVAQVRDPRFVVAPGTAMIGEGSQDRREITRHGNRRRHMRCDAIGMIDDVGDLRVAEAAEPHSEVERRADDDHDVGFTLEHRPGTTERQVVIGGQAAASQTVEVDRHAQRLGGGA